MITKITTSIALLLAIVLLGTSAVLAQALGEKSISHVLKPNSVERILVQELVLDAPLKVVWEAYTTEEGWKAWAVPMIKMDFRTGGKILTAYEGELGGEGTITLDILHYVPNVLIALKPDYSKNWPEVMDQGGDNLASVTLFDAITPNRTRLRTYGVGYRDSPEYDNLMKFFIQGNEWLFSKLKAYVEEGKRTEWDT